MKITMKSCATIVALLCSGTTFAAEDGWTTDFAAAKKAATESKKDLLLDFTGSDWCGWCIKLKDEVFSKEAFKQGTKDKFVLVELDFPKKKELDAKLKEQNEALQKEMNIQGFPTIMLCDATGKPYAQMGYQPGGPEKYVESLDKHQAARVKRDESFAAADKATDDVEKAKFLVAGLKTMDDEIVESCYGDIAEKIGKLDKEDKSGFTKARKEAEGKKQALEKSQAAIQEFYMSKVQPLMVSKDFDKASSEVKNYIKENPNTPEEIQVALLMNVGLAGPMTKGDSAGAMAVVDEVVKAYPDNDISKNVDKVKESIKARLESMKKPTGDTKEEK